MRVDNLQAETTITENGARVYSPNNKPSASDIGALPSNSKAADAIKSDTVSGTNLGKTDTPYITIPNVAWYANAPVGRAQMIKSDSYGLPIAANGYIFKIGARDVSGGSSWIFSTDYAGVGTRVFFGTCETSSHDPKWHEVYSPNHKPTAADVGAHPTSWKPTWNDVQSKPAQATRWPSWNEVTGKPSTITPSSHTHPWSQITGEPVYTQRWPNWNEVSGKPGNLLTQTTADTRYLGKTAKASSATSADSAYRATILQSQHRYPATESNSNDIKPGDYRVQYNTYDKGFKYTPAGVHNANGIITLSTHPGGYRAQLLFCSDGKLYHRSTADNTTFNTGFAEVYTSLNKPTPGTLGVYSKTEGDGRYMYKNGNNFNGDLVSTSRNKGLFGVYDSKRTDQIWSMGTAYRNNSAGTNFGNLYGLAYKHTNNPTGGTMAAGHQAVWCENGVPKAAMGSSGLWASGAVYIGSSRHTAWHNGNKPSPATIGAEPTLAGDRKRKITYGTGNPSGGSSGDIYIQYK
ncbi:tail fiber protein [Vibrio phage Thalassa]|uniref:Tail fiber family protein n=1 Tax=Vibrio phage Thalassa TaxID=2570301 RepID=A0A2H5BH00_9CAUD|nr:tail fiber protein [Vibrio phage Thalassa]AUG85240.1 tail fiber family protein [Vibrio phage Thalassa]